jgi:hypothetical protein
MLSKSKVKVAVLIASHIRYNNQIQYFRRCLNSLVNQPCQVIVSVSMEKKYIQAVESLQNTFLNVIWDVKTTQLFQMEHFHSLLRHVENYDLIMFCDDDDEYGPNRVKEFSTNYLLKNGTKVINKKGESIPACIYVDVLKKIDSKDDDMNYTLAEIGKTWKSLEYWNYAITPEVFQTFWKRISEADMKHLHYSCADLYFSNFLKYPSLFALVTWDNSDQSTSYIYRIHQKSVCGKLAQLSRSEGIRHNLRCLLTIPLGAFNENKVDTFKILSELCLDMSQDEIFTLIDFNKKIYA